MNNLTGFAHMRVSSHIGEWRGLTGSLQPIIYNNKPL